MGTEAGQDFTRLVNELQHRAPEFNIFQAIFIGERVGKQLHPERDDEKFDQAGLKFRPYEMYTYPPSDLRSFSYDNRLMQYVINYMGLYGVNASLPRCYHEQVAVQQTIHEEGHVPLQNFLDIFNNRFYWLYYNAWKKYRSYLHLTTDTDNKTTQRIFSFIGLGFGEEFAKENITPFKLFQLSGILSNKIKNKGGLQILLQEFFPKFQFHIQEFIPTMVPLSELPSLGRSNGTLQHTLGNSSVVGRSIRDYNSKIRVQIGPIDFDDYLGFLPGGKKINLVKNLIELYLNNTLTYDIQFLVKSEGIKTVDWRDERLKLGFSLWLGKPKKEIVDVYYSSEKLNQ